MGRAQRHKRQADPVRQINYAKAEGIPVLLVGTRATIGDLAAASELPWLHELPGDALCPAAVACDVDREPFADVGRLFDLFAGGLVVMPEPAAWLPEGRREQTLQALAQHLRPEHLQEVRVLLASGAMNWERSYPPIPEAAATAQAVLVHCNGGLLRAGFRKR